MGNNKVMTGFECWRKTTGMTVRVLLLYYFLNIPKKHPFLRRKSIVNVFPFGIFLLLLFGA